MRFYSHGSTIGVVFSGWLGVLLLVYIFSELLSIFTTRTTLFRRIYIYFKIKKEVPKIIPVWWELKYVSLITISRVAGVASDINSDRYEVYLKILSKISPKDWMDKKSWTNASVVVDKSGNITNKSELLKRTKLGDVVNDVTDEMIKQYVRDRSLTDLGIK